VTPPRTEPGPASNAPQTDNLDNIRKKLSNKVSEDQAEVFLRARAAQPALPGTLLALLDEVGERTRHFVGVRLNDSSDRCAELVAAVPAGE
jgi:hypothetical protein